MRPQLWILGALVVLVLGAIVVLLLASAGPWCPGKTTETITRDVYEGSTKVGGLNFVIEKETRWSWIRIGIPFVKVPRLVTRILVFAPGTAVLTTTQDAHRTELGPISECHRLQRWGSGFYGSPNSLEGVMTALTNYFNACAVADPHLKVPLEVRD